MTEQKSEVMQRLLGTQLSCKIRHICTCCRNYNKYNLMKEDRQIIKTTAQLHRFCGNAELILLYINNL
jgi:D-serine deaminase-like pyridoxal phosphate-dependent protein